MHPIDLTQKEYERLKKAQDISKWGHLGTWKELYVYQRIAMKRGTKEDVEQVKEIGKIGKRKTDGENIMLPYMRYKI